MSTTTHLGGVPLTRATAVNQQLEEDFVKAVQAKMDELFYICTLKVNADAGNQPTIVTVRQIEHSLRNCSDVVRSRMVAKCVMHFGAIKEA